MGWNTYNFCLFVCLSLKVTRAISGGEDIFESLVFSDQYVGPKQPEDE